MHVTLVTVHLTGQDREVSVEPGIFELGRSRECDLRIDSPLVSRHHCELTHGDHEVWVRDTSRHGTWVNDHRVVDPCQLHDGDQLRLAATVFEVRIIGEVPAPDLVSRVYRALSQIVQPSHKAD